MVKAVVKLNTNETVSEFRKRLREFCKDKLPVYKIPQKVVLTTEKMHTDRFKKTRKYLCNYSFYNRERSP